MRSCAAWTSTLTGFTKNGPESDPDEIFEFFFQPLDSLTMPDMIDPNREILDRPRHVPARSQSIYQNVFCILSFESISFISQNYLRAIEGTDPG